MPPSRRETGTVPRYEDRQPGPPHPAGELLVGRRNRHPVADRHIEDGVVPFTRPLPSNESGRPGKCGNRRTGSLGGQPEELAVHRCRNNPDRTLVPPGQLAE